MSKLDYETPPHRPPARFGAWIVAGVGAWLLVMSLLVPVPQAVGVATVGVLVLISAGVYALLQRRRFSK